MLPIHDIDTPSRWSGKLYLFKDKQGEHISATHPRTLSIDANQIYAYVVIGPFVPIAWPKILDVKDASKWLEDLKGKGFSCEPATVD